MPASVSSNRPASDTETSTSAAAADVLMSGHGFLLYDQMVDQLGQCRVRPGRHTFRGDAQCQRQIVTQAKQGDGGRRLRGNAGGADNTAYQRKRRFLGKRQERDPASTVTSHETAEPIATGNEDEARWTTRQQRPDLVGSRGVVENDEHAFAGYQTSI